MNFRSFILGICSILSFFVYLPDCALAMRRSSPPPSGVVPFVRSIRTAPRAIHPRVAMSLMSGGWRVRSITQPYSSTTSEQLAQSPRFFFFSNDIVRQTDIHRDELSSILSHLIVTDSWTRNRVLCGLLTLQDVESQAQATYVYQIEILHGVRPHRGYLLQYEMIDGNFTMIEINEIEFISTEDPLSSSED